MDKDSLSKYILIATVPALLMLISWVVLQVINLNDRITKVEAVQFTQDEADDVKDTLRTIEGQQVIPQAVYDRITSLELRFAQLQSTIDRIDKKLDSLQDLLTEKQRE